MFGGFTNESGLSEEQIYTGTPDSAAMVAALILVSIPPVPFAEPEPPAISMISWLMCSILSSRTASGLLFGLPV